MKASLRFIVLGLAGAFALFFAATSQAKKFTVHVGLGGDVFSPPAITIEQGDQIEWVWDAAFHSTTSGTPGNPSGLWDSGVHQTDFKFTHEFFDLGTFPYFCSVHGSCCMMTGSVKVIAGSPTPSPTPTSTPSPSPSPTPTATPGSILPLIATGPVRIALQEVASGLSAPLDFATTGDGRLFVVEQTGKIRLIKNGALVAAAFLDVSARLVGTTAEVGLLGVAFHPGYNDPASPGFRKFYTYTSEPVTGPADFTVPITGAFNHQSVVAEWKQSAPTPDVADPASRREVLRVDEPQSNHNGGQLAFRPGEEYLYISLGDGGAGNDVGPGHNSSIGNGQDLTTVLGKILRICPLAPALTPGSPDPVSANGKYRVPASNPFINSSTTVHEIFAYGFRNPYRFSFDTPTDRLIVGDVGQGNVEEVDIVTAGKNYGWNRKEGSFLFNPDDGSVTPDPSPDPALVDPVLEYSHADGNAVIGGFVARGAAVPALNGRYVFGDFITDAGAGRLFESDFAAGLIQEIGVGNRAMSLGKSVRGFGRDDNGDVYLLANGAGGGVVDKITAIAPAPTLVNLSTRLQVGTGDNVLIGGFIITGSEDEEVVLRGIGPSLQVGGVPLVGRLPNPKIELRDGSGALLSSNDNWMNSPDKNEITSLNLAPNNDLEAALVAHLAPGSYTTVLRDAQGGTGVGLVELYALNAAANPVNISTRGFVQTGDDVMIGGFIIGGTDPRQLILRAIGPSLAAQNVANPLLDPTLELHNQNGALIQSNDDWRDPQEAAIVASGIPPNDDREAAIVATLTPGNYTAVVRGANNTTGVALVEAFDLP